MITVESPVPFNYTTVRATQSRIDKGLLAIPVSMSHWFPRKRGTITVYAGMDEVASPKNYTPLQSTSGECRIGGMKGFFSDFKVKDGDEVVIQRLDENAYRMIPERQFQATIRTVEVALDKVFRDEDVPRHIGRLSRIAHSTWSEVLLGQYLRLSKTDLPTRRVHAPHPTTKKGNVSPFLKRILADIYGGKCQVTGFSFLMRNGKPYFEVHHLRPEIGDHVKNLLLVCPNVHAQFTYANVRETFDEHGWLRKVQFNEQEYRVAHAIDAMPVFTKEVHLDVSSGA